MAKKTRNVAPLGPELADKILAIVKRHANVRFDSQTDRDLLLAELAGLDGEAASTPEPPALRSLEAAGTGRQVAGVPADELGAGNEDETAPGYARDGD